MENERLSAAVLALDPGGTTGAALSQIGPDMMATVKHWEAQADEVLGWLSSALACGVLDRVVIERFSPRRWDSDAMDTVEIIGAIKWMCKQADVPLGEVNASDKHKTLPDVIVEKAGLNHARDAEAVRLWDLKYGRW